MLESKIIETAQELEQILKVTVRPQDFGIQGVSLFGSLARGEVAHDVDLLIHHYESTDDLLRFQEMLEKVCGLPVDIVPEKSMNPIIRYRASKDLRHVA